MFAKRFFNLLFLFVVIPVCQAVDIQSWQLPSGAKVMFVESHQIPIIDVNISFDAGSRRDQPDKIGVANFSAGLLDSGAGKLNEEAVRNKMAQLAISLGSSSGLESASLSLRSLSKAEVMQPALELANLILTKPTFDEKILKREQARAIQGLKQGETNPGFLANRAITLLDYPDHPYGFSAKTTEQTIRAIKREDLVRFYQKHFVTENAVISIVGDVNRKEAEQIALNLTKGLPQGQKQVPLVAVNVNGGQIKRISHPASQAHVQLALPLFTRDDPDYYALLVGNYVLGSGGFDSRLMKVLRDEQGMVYGVSSYFSPYEQKGEFGISFSTKKNQADQALTLTRETLSQFIQQGPSDKELQQAKDNIIGGFPLRFDSNSKLIAYLDVIGRYNLPLTFLDDYPKKVQALTKEEIRAAWQKRVRPDQLNVVIVGGQVQ